MQAGRLRHKIVIQENRPTEKDEYGAPVDNWVDVLECRAGMEPLSGRQYFAARQVQAEQITRFPIRYPRIQIWAGMRIKYHDPVLNYDRYFNIDAAIDQNEGHREVFIMGTEQIKPAVTYSDKAAPAGSGESS